MSTSERSELSAMRRTATPTPDALEPEAPAEAESDGPAFVAACAVAPNSIWAAAIPPSELTDETSMVQASHEHGRKPPDPRANSTNVQVEPAGPWPGVPT